MPSFGNPALRRPPNFSKHNLKADTKKLKNYVVGGLKKVYSSKPKTYRRAKKSSGK